MPPSEIVPLGGKIVEARVLLSCVACELTWLCGVLSCHHVGITSVSVAAHKGREEIVKMLISADADVNIDSKNGSTPLIQASHFGRFVDPASRKVVDVAASTPIHGA